MKVINVAGARPNFMKIAPLMEAWKTFPGVEALLVHTGQHYDEKMSDLFFRQLGIPEPDYNLEVGSASHAVQTADVMVRFEELCLKLKPDLILVVGDVNSTVACSLVAAKLQIKIAHVEAGLRSNDRAMPEEVNRLVTDVLSDFLFTTSPDADENLISEGIAKEKIFFTGNVMIDTLLKFRKEAESEASSFPYLKPKSFALATLHRPSNVDNKEKLAEILSAFEEIGKDMPVIFALHPRTLKQIKHFGLGGTWKTFRQDKPAEPGILTAPPFGYLQFMYLTGNAGVVLTDSGGIQEETTVLHVPCLTLRENTERPVTITSGTNQLVIPSKKNILKAYQKVKEHRIDTSRMPEKWDGNAAMRICSLLVEKMKSP